jgi:RHS repeat-associated protein
LADSTGALQTQYTFEPFGNTTVTGASTTNTFAFTGRELDATGLYFYRARYYSPSLQRFISEDPIGFRGGINLYAYTSDSPIIATDPSGNCSDPGGPGTRYCIDRYIPTARTPFPFSPWDGNNRGPDPYGGDFKTEQMVFQNGGNWTGYCQTGVSKIFGILPVQGWLGPNGVHGRKGGVIGASCEGGIGHFLGLAPNIVTNVDIRPDGSISVTGTMYPSLEIWRYQNGQLPALLLNYDATGGNPGSLSLGGNFPIISGAPFKF